MDEKQTNELYCFSIPANAISNSYIFGIHYSHWLEALVFIGAIDYIIWHINFVMRIKLILIAVLSISLLVVFLKGIKGRTLTQAIIYGIIGLKKRKEYHLGGIYDDRKAADMAEFAGMSGAEQVVMFFKHKRNFLEDRYGKEPEDENTDSPN